MTDPTLTLKSIIAAGARRARAIPATVEAIPPQEHRKILQVLRRLVDNCPFCGKKPRIGPTEPWNDGNAWGFVKCTNGRCAVQPEARDGSDVADERGPGAYIALAIRRWNRRP